MTTNSDRLAWFREAKFGIFVHWGIYSAIGRGEQLILRAVLRTTQACKGRPDFPGPPLV